MSVSKGLGSPVPFFDAQKITMSIGPDVDGMVRRIVFNNDGSHESAITPIADLPKSERTTLALAKARIDSKRFT